MGTVPQKVSQKVYAAICVPIDAAGIIASKSDGLEKTSKFLISVIDTLQGVCTHFGRVTALAATVVLRGKLKIVADVISGLNFINRVFEWICPEPGKAKPFWLAQTRTSKERWSLNFKIVSRIFLTGAHFIDFMKLLDSFGLITLGRITSETVGRVPILSLVKDTAVVISSGFSIASSLISLAEVTPKWNRARRKTAQWKEVGDVLNARGNSTDRDDSGAKAAKKRNLENRLAEKCRTKRAHYEKERSSITAKIARNCRNQGLVDQLERPFASDDERNAHIQSIIAGSQDGTKVRQLIAKRDEVISKRDKWGDKILEIPSGNNSQAILKGGVEGYCVRKLDSAINRTQASVNRSQTQIDRIRGEQGDEKQEVAATLLQKPMAELSTSQAALEVLTTLKDNGNADRFINHHYETFNAEKANTFRKMSKNWIGVAYDIAKITIITFSVISLAVSFTAFWPITLLALSVNGMGLFKFLYDELIAKKIDVAPKLTVAAPAA